MRTKALILGFADLTRESRFLSLPRFEPEPVPVHVKWTKTSIKSLIFHLRFASSRNKALVLNAKRCLNVYVLAKDDGKSWKKVEDLILGFCLSFDIFELVLK